MANSIQAQPTLALRHWVLVITGVVMIAVPWWLGLLWLFGALR